MINCDSTSAKLICVYNPSIQTPPGLQRAMTQVASTVLLRTNNHYEDTEERSFNF